MAAPTEDRRRISSRVSVLQVGAIIWFAALAICFWVLQVVQTDKYVEMANSNYQRTLSLRAPRGVLFDREGRVLVENRDSFTISIDRELTKDIAETIRTASALLGLDAEQVKQAVDRHVKSEPVYRPVVIVQDASLEQAVRVLSRQRELPELSVEQVPTRKYPADAMAAHLFGYVGQADEDQVKAEGLSQNAIVGKFGVEKVYNAVLMGQDGAKSVVVNSVGREIRELDKIPPTEGRRVQLTIDYDLQKAAEDGFRHAGFNGAALIMDPRTGEVLVHASTPSYDPNDFAAGVKSATWSALTTDKLRPLTNRVLQGRYSPGSTFKIVVATAAMEEGLVDSNFRVNCAGGANFYGRFYKCHLRGGHGSVDMRHAMEKSCNTYFYTLGNMLGVDRIYKWAEKLGLAGKTGIDLPNEQESLVPNTEWKLKRTGERWYPGETISVAIGQGQVSVTPAGLANMIATVANGGTRITPHVVKAIDQGNGWTPVPLKAVADRVAFRPDTLAALHDGLWMVVNAAGTGRRGRVDGRDVAGKTGTAQVISNEGRARARNSGRDLRDHGWFVFFAPKDNPQIAGVIFGEHNEHGYLGAPIARHVIETYFAKKEGKPLPVLGEKPSNEPPVDDPDSPPALPAVEVADARPLHSRTAAQ
ncbi:MAG TPA: penicillin-binding protein 2 [Vicinamibacterales bacterium]|nr:penicillin-binding protein 2 [Vicinamibacterales bacterium]